MSKNKQILKAMHYLNTFPQYRIVHKKLYVILEHYGDYGWCSGGSYNIWRVVEKVYFD